MRVLEQPLVFVDIETNGLSHTRGKVIEVAAIRVEDGIVSGSINSILDPLTEIPPFISQLTGITHQDIKGAPTFSDIADELYRLIDGAVFVAHNARFDYSFLKQEFKRIGQQFNPKLLCTVKLSQALYPEHRSHKLEKLIERLGLNPARRHRAYDDALVLWQFLQHAEKTFDSKIIDTAVKQQLKSPSLPKGLSRQLLNSLPESHGVYIFEDENASPLYIGKSINIKKRVLSHFSRDHEIESEFKISQQIKNISVIETGGELEALLLESRLIKEKQPLYNRMLRRNQKLTLARQITSEDGYIRVSIDEVAAIDPTDTSDILAVYTTKGKAREYLNQAIKDHLLCPKLLGLEKSKSSCFLYQLKKCDGACVGKEPAKKYNARLLSYFDGKRIEQWPYGTPIAISEYGPEQHSKSIIVDQWCVIADISQDEGCSPVVKYYDKAFDIDTYKILRAYLGNKMSKLKIHPASLDNINHMPGLAGL